VYWPVNRECKCSFSELFENPIPEIAVADYQKVRPSAKIIRDSDWMVDYNKLKGSIVINHSWRFLLFPEDKILRNHPLPFLPGGDGKGIDFKYHDIPLILQKDFLHYVNSLIPKKALIEKADEFARQFDDDTVSVQLRTWKGNPRMDIQRHLLFDIRSARKVMDRHIGKKFFMSCDFEPIFREFQERYRSRILYYPEDRFQENRRFAQDIQHSFIKLLLLAKNKKIIVSRLTTFSEMAWWFSGCRAEVETIPILLLNHFLFAYRTFSKSKK
jgi:hypothetical protein